MSKMAELAYDIEQLYIEGYSPKSIAVQLECPLSVVYDWLEATNVSDTKADAAEWGELEADDFNPYDTINS
jgi:transposase